MNMYLSAKIQKIIDKRPKDVIQPDILQQIEEIDPEKLQVVLDVFEMNEDEDDVIDNLNLTFKMSAICKLYFFFYFLFFIFYFC